MSPLSQMTIFSVAAGLSVFVVCLYLYSVYTTTPPRARV